MPGSSLLASIRATPYESSDEHTRLRLAKISPAPSAPPSAHQCVTANDVATRWWMNIYIYAMMPAAFDIVCIYALSLLANAFLWYTTEQNVWFFLGLESTVKITVIAWTSVQLMRADALNGCSPAALPECIVIVNEDVSAPGHYEIKDLNVVKVE